MNDLISIQAAVELAMKYCPDDDGTVQCDGDIRGLLDELENLPPAQPEIIRCRDCKHFKRDYFSNVCGVPIITCHNICTKWNGRDGGCVTREDGYCFLGERKDMRSKNGGMEVEHNGIQ